MAPAIAAEFPRLPHAAGLMGRGSEVLGYDDSMSTDHTWSARVIVFVPGEVLVEQGESVQAQLTARIPDHFDGLPTEVKVTTVQHYFLDRARSGRFGRLGRLRLGQSAGATSVCHDGGSRVPR